MSNSAHSFLNAPENNQRRFRVGTLTHLLAIERRMARCLVHVCKGFDNHTSEHVTEDIPERSARTVRHHSHADDVPADEQTKCPRRTATVGVKVV